MLKRTWWTVSKNCTKLSSSYEHCFVLILPIYYLSSYTPLEFFKYSSCNCYNWVYTSWSNHGNYETVCSNHLLRFHFAIHPGRQKAWWGVLFFLFSFFSGFHQVQMTFDSFTYTEWTVTNKDLAQYLMFNAALLLNKSAFMIKLVDVLCSWYLLY